LQGEQLEPHERYEYKTGQRLYLDSGKECSLRITPIFQKDIVDLEMQEKGLELEKKKHELRSRRRVGQNLKDVEARQNFVDNAASAVDNVFDNLIYIAKSARFNKEKKIREAEHISQEMIEKAQQQMETQRALLEKELRSLQVKTKKEANRVLKSANEKANQHLKKAEEKARDIEKEAQKKHEGAIKAGEVRKLEIIESAQEKHSEIIAEAHLKNKELKEENIKLDRDLAGGREKLIRLNDEIKSLQSAADEYRKETEVAKEAFVQEQSQLDNMRDQVSSLEKRNVAALEVLENQIPDLERKAASLDAEIFDANIEIKKKQTEYERLEKEIEDLQFEIARNQDKAAASEKRMDELNDKIIEGEDNLFRLNKIKQQRHEELDREIAERKAQQATREEKAKEKIDRQWDKAKREIEVNISNAKERALSIVAEAQQEAEQIIVQSKLEETQTRQRVDEDLKSARQEAETLRAEAQEFNLKTRHAAEDYAARVREEADTDIASRRKNFDLEVQEAKDRLLADSRQEAQNIRKQARQHAEGLVKNAKEEANHALATARIDIEKQQANWQVELESQRTDLQAEIEKRQKETEEEIHALRAHAVQKLEEQRQEAEKDEAERNRLRVLRLRKELNQVLRARISPFLKDQSQIEKISQMMSKSVNAILLDEVDSESFDAENYSDIDPTLQQNQVKKFYFGAGAAALVLTLLFFLAPTLEQLAKDSGRNIATQIEEQDQKQIEAAQRANDLSAEFNPEMVDEYKASYTERVMYTKDYLRLENDPGFKSQWHLELEEFFVDKLRLTETDMVPFVAREAALIKELGEAREAINGNFVDEGKARLQEIEANFFQRVKDGGLNQKQIDQIMQFKKKFFLANRELFS
jgi:hypothetical protein